MFERILDNFPLLLLNLLAMRVNYSFCISLEITQVCGVQDDILTVKDKKIRDLKEKLAEQSKHRKLAENESKLRLQQERYLIGHNYANQDKSERNRSGNRLRGKLR